MAPLAPMSASPTDGHGRLVRGRWVGHLALDPVTVGPRAGRVRRWYYVGAADAATAVGAAVVDLGAVAVCFAWAVLDGRTVTFETRRPLRRGAWVGATPAAGAGLHTRTDRLLLGADGALDLDVPVDGARLRARVLARPGTEPVVLSTPTAGGGWNVTQKTAGIAVSGRVEVGRHGRDLDADAGGWSDWTSGRQDRRTRWRWAAGAGRDPDGRRVGLNVSTGMNEHGEGEDLVWWDGRPHPISLGRLAPTGPRTSGPWRIGGAAWSLDFAPWGARSADERLLVLRSRYVMPIGRFVGTLPGPDGAPVEVTLTGVTEDHLAVW